MSTEKLTKEQFYGAVTQYGLIEHEPISGEFRRHYSNINGVWGTAEGEGGVWRTAEDEGRPAQYLLYVPST